MECVRLHDKANMLLMCTYVDDLLIIECNIKEIEQFNKLLMIEFEMTNLGRLKYFLGMKFVENEKSLVLHQKKYVAEMLENFDMRECNIVATPSKVKVTAPENCSNHKRNMCWLQRRC